MKFYKLMYLNNFNNKILNVEHKKSSFLKNQENAFDKESTMAMVQLKALFFFFFFFVSFFPVSQISCGLDDISCKENAFAFIIIVMCLVIFFNAVCRT